jgi:methyl-accepting chemotaxis protein
MSLFLSFMNNTKILTKIFIGFGIVLALLLVISATGGVSLQSGEGNFTQYREQAALSNRAAMVQATLQKAQLAVGDYITQSSEDAIAEFEERISETMELIETLDGQVTDPKRKKTITNAIENLGTYRSAFDQVTSLQTKRNSISQSQMEVIGPDMESKLTALMQKSYDETDVSAAYRAAKTQRSLLLMRLYANKFITANQLDDFDKAMAAAGEMKENIAELQNELFDEERKAATAKIAEMLEQYEAALTEVSEVMAQRDELVLGTIGFVGPNIAALMNDLRNDLKTVQEALGPATSKAMKTAMMVTLVVAGVSVLLGVLAALLIGNGIARPVTALTAAMTSLAGGDKTVDIPSQKNGDEVGDMARAVLVFKESMIKADDLAAREREAQKRREERGRQIEALTGSFDSDVSALLQSLTTSAAEMTSTASTMSKIADGTNERAATVAGAAEQASANVQTVATATEELSSSIQEIARQVAQSSNVAERAVNEANHTDEQIQGLARAAQRIGEVVNMITDIAEQTNLLALNATIEAARAGDAGKGFAVVASEVKNLANQTAKATDEISQQIADIQAETQDAVRAIKSITSTISEMSEIASTIASAVEEQGAATSEIARNVEQASTGTQEVTSNIIEVTHSAGETGTAATQVTSVASSLNTQADHLKQQVERFLEGVRAA